MLITCTTWGKECRKSQQIIIVQFCNSCIVCFHCIPNQSTNPLGSGGVLADEFFILVRAMWVERFKQIAPRDFKLMIARVAPYFTGTQQHDCQEFLMYLLDGLHEDLNRVSTSSSTCSIYTCSICTKYYSSPAWVIVSSRRSVWKGLRISVITHCLLHWSIIDKFSNVIEWIGL